MITELQTILEEHLAVTQQLPTLLPEIEIILQRLYNVIRLNGKIFWMGNGGSAADAQHLAAELVGRFSRERRAIASLALSTDTSVLTAIANDYEYAYVFARQLEALCTPQDAVIGISTSGNSVNVLRGIETARAKGAYTIGFTGAQGGQLLSLVDTCLQVPSQTTARIQEAHGLLGHMICDGLEMLVCAHADAALEQS